MKRVNYTHFQIQLIQTVLLADWKKNSIPAGAGGGGWGRGVGVLSIIAYTERLRPKEVPFSGFRHMKG